jgi:hypothetical protein
LVNFPIKGRNSDDTEEYTEQIQQLLEEVKKCVEQRNLQYKEYVDQYRRWKEFEIGYLVTAFLEEERFPTFPKQQIEVQEDWAM